MIPRTVHYCWFGTGKLSPVARRCIDSWRRHLPDYEIRLWNEQNFDVEGVRYTREACRRRKYAFVSDYVRLWALKNHGGVYMDTDVEVLKSLDPFLHLPAFAGFEQDGIQTGLLASEKQGAWVTGLLDEYADRPFILPDGSSDFTTNVQIITRRMLPHGFVVDGNYQQIEGLVTVFPKDYFCANHPLTQKKTITPNTHTIHHFEGSWIGPFQRFKNSSRPLLRKLGIHDSARRLYKSIRWPSM